MSILSSFKKRATLDAAIKQVAKARKSTGGLADQLYKGAYQGFASVVADNLILSEALYNWGLALLHEANTQAPEAAIITLNDAINKFTFCLLTAPEYLGAAIDGGVAYMALARLSTEEAKPALYLKAKAFFDTANTIQKGTAAYNLACIHAINGDETACLAALKLAKEFGSLPAKDEILHDADVANVVALPWFTEFFAELEKPPTVEELAQIKKEKQQEADNIEPVFKIKKTEEFDYYSK